MSKWFLENQIGLNPPFLLKSIINDRTIRRRTECNTRNQQRIPETECARLKILEIDSKYKEIKLCGFIRNKIEIIPIDVAAFNGSVATINGSVATINGSVTTFSCYDNVNLFLYVFDNDKLRMFFTEFCCCSLWGNRQIFLEEIGLFGRETFIEKGKKKIGIKISVENLRNQGYHYNICNTKDDKHVFNTNTQDKPETTYNVKFYGSNFRVNKFMCVLCMKTYQNREELEKHTNHSHLNYRAEYLDNIMHLKLISEFIDTEKEFTFLRKPRRQSSFDLKDSFSLRLKIQIEREYDLIDTADVLIAHLNQRIEDDGSNLSGIMRLWNELQIREGNVQRALMGVLKTFGMCKETLQLLDVVYCKGVLNSNEIMQVLNTLEEP